MRLFGSFITGRYGATPDIDLAVDGLPAARFFDLLAALQVRAAPIEVDLVEMADNVMAEELDRSFHEVLTTRSCRNWYGFCP